MQGAYYYFFCEKNIVKQQEVSLGCSWCVPKKNSAVAHCNVTASSEHPHCQVLVPARDYLLIMAFVTLEHQL